MLKKLKVNFMLKIRLVGTKLVMFFIVNCTVLTACLTLGTVNCFSQPTQQWVKRFSWGTFAGGIGIKLDSMGFVYVLMKIYSSATNDSYGLVKYTTSGSQIWSVYYNDSPGISDDHPAAFAVTPSGDVYITGTSNINLNEHVVTVKYNSNGKLQWAKEYYNYGGSTSSDLDLTLDRRGNPILAGIVGLVIKYDSNGDTLWTRRFNQLSGGSTGNIVHTDDNCNIYTGGTYYPDSIHAFALIVKYDSSGDIKWYSTTFNDTLHKQDVATSMAIDGSGNVYTAGLYEPPTGYFDNSLLKVSSNGIIQWSSVYRGIGGNDECGYTPAGVSVTTDGSAIYYTTYAANGTGGGCNDIIILKYGQVGDSLWIRRCSGTTHCYNQPADLKLDRFNDVYVTGLINNITTGNDYGTVKYSPDGTEQWLATYTGSYATSDDGATSLCIDTSLSLYVTGHSSNASNHNNFDAVTIRYSQPIGIIPNINRMAETFILNQNYPNPFNPLTLIAYSVPRKSNVRVSIYDIAGQLVKTLVNTEQNSGNYSVTYDADDLSSGVYFYSMFANNSLVGTRKMILIK